MNLIYETVNKFISYINIKIEKIYVKNKSLIWKLRHEEEKILLTLIRFKIK